MAKTPTPAPAAELLMGAALLAAIGAGTVSRINEAQSQSLDAGHYAVDLTDVVDGFAAVTLTDAGKAAASAGGATAPAAASRASIVIDDDVAMPDFGTRSARESVYPFDELEVGKSFHVAKTADRPDPAATLSSSITGAHIRYSPVITGADGKPEMEEYKSPVYQKDEAGEFVKVDGKRVKTGEETKTREKRGEPTRQFRIQKVGADDPRGEGIRVWRTR